MCEIGDVLREGEERFMFGDVCVGKPFKCIADTFSLGCNDEHAVAAKVFKCRAKVVSALCMCIPGRALSGFDVDGNLHADGGDWMSIEIEGSADRCISGDVGSDVGRA